MRHHELSKQGMWVRPNPAEDVRRLNAEKVLDVGCGNGRHMIFPVSVGLDNDPRAIEKARHRGPCVLGDAHHLPFRSVFDISLLWGVLNFVEDPNKVYAEANRVAYEDPVYSLVNNAKNARWIIKIRAPYLMQEKLEDFP